MNKAPIKNFLFGKGFFVALCLIVMSIIGYHAVNILKHHNSDISTHGISVRHVVSDYAIWNIKVIAEGKSLKTATTKLKADKESVFNFLKNAGFSDNEISEEAVKVEDRANGWGSWSSDSAHLRFAASMAFSIQSQKLENIRKSTLDITKLFENNIKTESSVRYLYKDLDKLRIEMLEEATQDSKNRADKIAKSLGLKLAGVSNITTGTFSIFSEDAGVLSTNDWNEGEESVKKRVKVVVHSSFYFK